MHRNAVKAGIIFSLTAVMSLGGARAGAQATLSASQVADRNAAARGGLEAWRAVHSLRMEGNLGVGGNQREPAPVFYHDRQKVTLPTDAKPKQEVQIPFVMEAERPRKLRFEITFEGKKAIQVYDGTNGWKLRPYLNRREVEPFTPQELKLASEQSQLDGPLVDYAAKGTSIALEGMDKVEGRDAYRLRLTKKDGQVTHVWVDAQTFLEAKVEGMPRALDGHEHPVEVYYSDYRSVNGLIVPFAIETRVLPIAGAHATETPVPPEEIHIDKVVINPPLPDKLFAKLQPSDGLEPLVR